MKKYICLILVICLILTTFTCCSTNTEDETTSPESTEVQTTAEDAVIQRDITLGYYGGKEINPFKTDSPINRNLASLLYDPLFICDSTYTAEPIIAVSSENKDNGLIVELDSDAVFFTGSKITSQDVVYSFNLAKQSTFYSSRLSNFSSATAGDGNVIFVLSTPDVFAENCLNFPIVKYGTGGDTLPTGSGRYIIKKDDKGYYLLANENSTRGEVMATKQIRLTAVDASDGELYMLQTGDLSYFFDDFSNSEATKIGANMLPVALNNLVYLGFNSEKEFWKNKNLLKAIEYSIDKTTVFDVAYNGFCTTANSIFNPNWAMLKDVNIPEHEYSTVKANELLEDIGYIYAYENNEYRSKNFEFLELTLVVNTENTAKLKCANLIIKSLESVGIKVNAQKLSFEEYKEVLKKGEFDLYVGEVKLNSNMNLSSFFTQGGDASWGIDTESTVAKAASDLSAGIIDVNTFIQVFNEEKPLIPICYRNGIAYFSREITFEGTVSEYEPFDNIYSWEIGENVLSQNIKEE